MDAAGAEEPQPFSRKPYSSLEFKVFLVRECTISPRGKLSEARALRGSPLPHEAAGEAVKQGVYAPALLNGAPIPVIMAVTVNYKLS